nr:MAG TPA: hypothetical protein [Caudoviricetes sp.]
MSYLAYFHMPKTLILRGFWYVELTNLMRGK